MTARPPSVVMVLTRKLPESANDGHERNVLLIRTAISSAAEVSTFILSSLPERKSKIAWLRAMLHGALSILMLRPKPVQTLLFHDKARCRALVELVTRLQPTCVYFDSVRTEEYVLAVRKAAPNMKLICNFEDLMSERMRVYGEKGFAISAGYLSSHIPGWISRFVFNGLPGRLLKKYEAATLEKAEDRLARVTDGIALISANEGQKFRDRLIDRWRPRVHVIHPHFEFKDDVAPPQEPYRFVFIGSDKVLQNQLPIIMLLRLWQDKQPRIRLDIYGKMLGTYPEVPMVTFKGFAPSLNEVYSHNSIVLAPALVPGGLKTKTFEALAYGRLVVGNETTFQGLGLSTDGLAFTAEQIADLVQAPERYLPALQQATREFRLKCKEILSETRFAANWQNLVLGNSSGLPA